MPLPRGKSLEILVSDLVAWETEDRFHRGGVGGLNDPNFEASGAKNVLVGSWKEEGSSLGSELASADASRLLVLSSWTASVTSVASGVPTSVFGASFEFVRFALGRFLSVE
jgi:hypothetical protein